MKTLKIDYRKLISVMILGTVLLVFLAWLRVVPAGASMEILTTPMGVATSTSTILLPADVVVNAAPSNLLCFVAGEVLPVYDGPTPWDYLNGRLAVGEAVRSYDHQVYVTQDGWRYVYNGRVAGWVRAVGLKEVDCE